MQSKRVPKSQPARSAKKSAGDAAPVKATALLTKQHREVEALFERIEKASDKRQKRALVQEVADRLAAHMLIEQEFFYPACRAQPKLADMIYEAHEEHGVADYEMQRLLATAASEKTFDAKFTVLTELIKHHVKEEEGELFPKAERALGLEKVRALGAKMTARFEQLTARPGARKLVKSPAQAAKVSSARSTKKSAK